MLMFFSMSIEQLYEAISKVMPSESFFEYVGVTKEEFDYYYQLFDEGDEEVVPEYMEDFFLIFENEESPQEMLEDTIEEFRLNTVIRNLPEDELRESIDAFHVEIMELYDQLNKEPEEDKKQALREKIEQQAVLLDIYEDAYWELPDNDEYTVFDMVIPDTEIEYGIIDYDLSKMVVIDPCGYEISDFKVNVYLTNKNSETLVEVGVYYPAENRKFVMIDDLIPCQQDYLMEVSVVVDGQQYYGELVPLMLDIFDE